MKLLIGVSLLVAAGVGARAWLSGHGCCCCSSKPETCAESAIAGRYVEARTASVYAGACHYNSELVNAGREAVYAWKIEKGSFGGTSLAGVDVVAAVGCEENLAVAKAPRKSVLYVDRHTSPKQREMALAWVRSQHMDSLGEVVGIESTDLQVDSDGERYHVRAGDVIALDGIAMPDRACCKMPFNVWYEPTEKLDHRLVGCSAKFACSEPRLGVSWSREGANDAFLGRFGATASSTEL